VTAGLLGLFRAFAQQEAERGRANDRRSQVVDPTSLREALAASNAASFRIGAPCASIVITDARAGSWLICTCSSSMCKKLPGKKQATRA